jgi:hypothetical protein
MKHQDKSRIGIVIAEDLRRIIRENSSITKTLLMEYAFARKELGDRILSLTRPIFSHWCLIKYVTLTGDRQQLKNHWKGELYS